MNFKYLMRLFEIVAGHHNLPVNIFAYSKLFIKIQLKSRFPSLPHPEALDGLRVYCWHSVSGVGSSSVLCLCSRQRRLRGSQQQLVTV